MPDLTVLLCYHMYLGDTFKCLLLTDFPAAIEFLFSCTFGLLLVFQVSQYCSKECQAYMCVVLVFRIFYFNMGSSTTSYLWMGEHTTLPMNSPVFSQFKFNTILSSG
jgi:hypothetical protein